MKNNFSIRPYAIWDKAQVIHLLQLNIPQYFSPPEEQGFSDYLDHKLELYFVVEADQTIIGCGGINFEEPNTGVISWDIIHPDHQGKGVGRSLLTFRLELLKGLDHIHRIIVRTSQHTDKFYAKLGFTLLDVKPDFWAEGFDLYYMEMKVK
jgi:N-acetylglutamate synthase-like GNAT family acetyltransferase